jgi:hypothetical protein
VRKQGAADFLQQCGATVQQMGMFTRDWSAQVTNSLETMSKLE